MTLTNEKTNKRHNLGKEVKKIKEICIGMNCDHRYDRIYQQAPILLKFLPFHLISVIQKLAGE